MSALPNPIVPPGPPPATRHFGTKHKWYLELLETFRALAGLPVLVSLVIEAFTTDTKIIGTGAVIAVIIALILRFFPKVRHTLIPHTGHAFWTALPWFSTAVLVLVLVFGVIPDRAIKQDNLLANSWLKWQNDLEKAAGQCTKARPLTWVARLQLAIMPTNQADQAKTAAEKDRAQCLARELTPVISNRPRPERKTDVTGMARDLMAGQLLLNDDNVSSVLGDRLSIGERFLGSGRSQPNDEKDYKAASVPEYLVPNLSDQSPDVWVWELDEGRIHGQKPIMERILLEVLRSSAPKYNADFVGNWDSLEGHLQPNDARPILVRFAALDPRKYSGCLGRPTATRVFMSNFGDLAQRTVGEAARSTGWTAPDKPDSSQKLFVWVYAPTGEYQAVSATWGNVLENFGKWITDEACKNPN